MRVPRMSAGSRSGVSCTRWNFAEIALASVVAVSVLATPGTPSSKRWPQPDRARPCVTAKGIAANSAVSMRRTSVCWPTMTLAISVSSPVTISPAACAFNAWCSIILLRGFAPQTPRTLARSSKYHPQKADRRRGDRQRNRVEIAVFRRRAPADERTFTLLDLLERLGEIAAGPRSEVAAAGRAGDVAQRRLLEPRADDTAVLVAQRRFLAVGEQLRHRDLVVRADADAVDVMPFLLVDGDLAPHFAAVVLAVRQQNEDLAGLAIVLPGDVERVLQRRADVGAEQGLRILLDPVEIERDGVEIARQVGQDQRAAGEADQPDAIDVLRLVLEEGADLLGRAREARRRYVVRAHRRRAVEHDHQVLALVLRRT